MKNLEEVTSAIEDYLRDIPKEAYFDHLIGFIDKTLRARFEDADFVLVAAGIGGETAVLSSLVPEDAMILLIAAADAAVLDNAPTTTMN